MMNQSPPILVLRLYQWRSQGLQSGRGGGQVERQRRKHCRGEILQNSEDYNIIRSRIPASSVIRLRIISWT
jgi:hypothetical protein